MLKRYPTYKILLLFSDFIILLLVIIISLKLHTVIFQYTSPLRIIDYIIHIITVIGLMTIFKANGLYKRHLVFTAIKQVSLIEKSLLFSFLLLIIVQFIFSPFLPILNKGYYYLLLLINVFIIFSLYRIILLRPIFKSKWLTKIMKIRVLIVGAGTKGKILAVEFKEEKKFEIDIIGFIDDNIDDNNNVYDNIKNLGNVKNIASITTSNNINEIYIAINNIDEKKLFNIVDKCLQTGIQVNVVSDLFSVINEKRIIEKINTIPIINTSRKANWYCTSYNIFNIKLSLKRLIDVFLALFLLFTFSPVFLLIMAMVRFSSEGPVLFKQKRVGLNGKLFTFYKFRSMFIGSDKDANREKRAKEFIMGKKHGIDSTKIINEKNITKFGRRIRKYSIDELPQLFNILKGDMSFVGPRPCLPYEWNTYRNWQKTRMNVLPGLTGLWQISGRSEVDFNDMVILDIYYIHNLTPWFDLEIIIKTIPVLFSGFGGK